MQLFLSFAIGCISSEEGMKREREKWPVSRFRRLKLNDRSLSRSEKLIAVLMDRDKIEGGTIVHCLYQYYSTLDFSILSIILNLVNQIGWITGGEWQDGDLNIFFFYLFVGIYVILELGFQLFPLVLSIYIENYYEFFNFFCEEVKVKCNDDEISGIF